MNKHKNELKPAQWGSLDEGDGVCAPFTQSPLHHRKEAG